VTDDVAVVNLFVPGMERFAIITDGNLVLPASAAPPCSTTCRPPLTTRRPRPFRSHRAKGPKARCEHAR